MSECVCEKLRIIYLINHSLPIWSQSPLLGLSVLSHTLCIDHVPLQTDPHNNSFKWWPHTPVWISEAELNPSVWMFIGYIDPDMILMTGELAVLNNKAFVSFFIHFFLLQVLPTWPRCDSVACSSILFLVTIYL